MILTNMLVVVYKILDFVIFKEYVLLVYVFLQKFVVNALMVNHKNKYIIVKKRIVKKVIFVVEVDFVVHNVKMEEYPLEVVI
ncbi:hypothetical protein Mgra_00009302 [Meloidogyne graminicola]|uniref:Uncharacterized protein n=1 Tax=Meloidogyne graminicola TaxID=189291 RepID=A0A8S9ZDD5_9BILA|nr:hypothetical protein Mgra_00009302 [Meloidogyne graminicola]